MTIDIGKEAADKVVNALNAIPGGYCYSGACSLQWCFPLKAGGELRFMLTDDMKEGELEIDHYDGAIPPGVSGPTTLTGPEK